MRGEHLKGVELHGGGAELKPGQRPRPRRQVVTRNPNHLHPTDAVARKLAHNAHAKPPAVALHVKYVSSVSEVELDTHVRYTGYVSVRI